jgi:hypothetical protein
MALDLTQGQSFHLVIKTNRHGQATPVRIVSDCERLIFVSAFNRFHRRTGAVASTVPIELPSFQSALQR